MLTAFHFLAATVRSLAEETEAMKRLMGSPDKSAEIASVCIIRISYTYQNDSLHLRKKKGFFECDVVFITANQHGSHSQLRALGGFWQGDAEAPGVPGQERGTSVASRSIRCCGARGGSVAFPNSPSTRPRKFWIAKDQILTFGPSLQKSTSAQPLSADVPRRMLERTPSSSLSSLNC